MWPGIPPSLQITGIFGVDVAEHRHGRSKETPVVADAIKSLHQKGMVAAANLHEPRFGHIDAALLRQILKQLLPYGNIVVVVGGRELGNPKTSLFINQIRFGASATE
jgi:hypothetical protein